MYASRRALIGLAATLTLVIATLVVQIHWSPEEESPHEEDQDTHRDDIEGPAHPTGETVNLTITILYDNNEYDHRLETAWGFSCLVEGLEKTILFDTGGDSAILLSNMAILGIDPGDIDAVVISHVHHDHAGGMAGLLQVHSDVTVYLPTSFPDDLKEAVTGSGARLVQVAGPVEICRHVHSTGELGGSVKEQSLVIDMGKGLVVITGCAHPGVLNIVQQAKKQLQGEVHLVLGGFHLSWTSSSKIQRIAEDMRREGVEKVAPCHCSGDPARTAFEELYGDDFIPAGVGSVIKVVGSPQDSGEQEGL